MDPLLNGMGKLQECLFGKTSWFGHQRTNLFLYVVPKKGRDYRHAMVIKIVHVFKLIRDKIKQCFDCLPFLWLSNSQEHNNERIAVSYPRNTGKIYSYFSSLSFVAPICPQY